MVAISSLRTFGTARETGERDSGATGSRSQAAEDAELLRRFNAGDEAAFAEIVVRHREKIYWLIQDFVHDHAEAEELTQDTFIRAYRGLVRFRGDSALATWLHRVAANLARNRYWFFRRRRRHATVSLDAAIVHGASVTLADYIVSDAPGPVREAEIGEFASILARGMTKLAAPYREILTMRNAMNQSYGDIARLLGIRIGTVKSRIMRARESLRAAIAADCPEFPCDAPLSDWFEHGRLSGIHRGIQDWSNAPRAVRQTADKDAGMG